MPAVPTIDEPVWSRLRAEAGDLGFVRVGIVALDHPGFAAARQALDEHVTSGHYGEMEFMARTHEVRKDPRAMLAAARSLIVAAVPHRGEPSPVARYAQSADYHTVLHRRLGELVVRLEALVPGVESIVCVDTRPIMERAAAALAGIGFLGKNGCVIVPGIGSYVLLGAVLCSAESRLSALPAPDVPWDACGTCRRCLDACPTEAFVAPGILDARRCISYLTIEARAPIPDVLADRLGVRVAGCDVCQEVCPYNASLRREARVAPHAWLDARPGGSAEVDLLALAEIGSSRYRAWVRHSALGRIPRRALRRNALLALGNLERALGPDERAVLERLVDDPEPQIRAAARRALRRRGGSVPDADP